MEEIFEIRCHIETQLFSTRSTVNKQLHKVYILGGPSSFKR